MLQVSGFRSLGFGGFRVLGYGGCARKRPQGVTSASSFFGSSMWCPARLRALGCYRCLFVFFFFGRFVRLQGFGARGLPISVLGFGFNVDP